MVGYFAKNGQILRGWEGSKGRVRGGVPGVGSGIRGLLPCLWWSMLGGVDRWSKQGGG